MRFLMMALRGIGRLCGATFATGVGLCWWLTRTCWEGWTGRSLAAEQAEREQAQARADEQAQAQAMAQADRQDAQARHEESAALAEQQLAATQALREDLLRNARRPVHRVEVTPSTHWESDDEPEPEGGAPLPAYA